MAELHVESGTLDGATDAPAMPCTRYLLSRLIDQLSVDARVSLTIVGAAFPDEAVSSHLSHVGISSNGDVG